MTRTFSRFSLRQANYHFEAVIMNIYDAEIRKTLRVLLKDNFC